MHFGKRSYNLNSFNRIITDAKRICSTDMMIGFINEAIACSDYELDWLEDSRVRSEFAAKTILSWLNYPGYRRNFVSMLNIKGTNEDRPQFDFVPSNFGEGRGYIFYFICPGCERRVKYLYMPRGTTVYRCRNCYNLRYPPRVAVPKEVLGDISEFGNYI